jgi:hypothetical protein
MIVVGHSEAQQISKISLSKTPCKNCDSKGALELWSFTQYIHLFFAPFVPNGKKSVIICSECGKDYSIEKQKESLQEIAKTEQQKLKYPWWYFSGLIFLVLIVLSVISYHQYDHFRDAEYVKSPIIGDIYEYKEKNGWYSSFIVNKVFQDSVYVRYNQYNIDDKYSVDKITMEGNFLPWTNSVSRKKLESMFESGEVTEIIR